MKLISGIASVAMMLAAAQALAQGEKANPPPSSPGWITASNQDCKIWNPEPQENETVTWSGGCKEGLAAGKGILKWFENGKPDVSFEGEYANGKRNGHGAIVTTDGKRLEGDWLNDQLVPAGERSTI